MSRAQILKSERCFHVKSSTYRFHMSTKILTDFQICISVPLPFVQFYRYYYQVHQSTQKDSVNLRLTQNTYYKF